MHDGYLRLLDPAEHTLITQQRQAVEEEHVDGTPQGDQPTITSPSTILCRTASSTKRAKLLERSDPWLSEAQLSSAQLR